MARSVTISIQTNTDKLIEYIERTNDTPTKTIHTNTQLLNNNKPLKFTHSLCDVSVKYHKQMFHLTFTTSTPNTDIYKAIHTFQQKFQSYEQQHYNYNGRPVDTITIKNNTFFNLRHIETLLGYSANYLKRYYVKHYGILVVENYTDKEGLKIILSHGRKPGCLDMMKQFGLDTATKIQSHEATVLEQLIDSLDTTERYTLQHQIGPYRIDMYLPDSKVAVEVDEQGHTDRDQVYEKTREEYIKNNLTTKILRINPHAPNFRMAKEIGNLHRLLRS
jgi:very-short-patch-repair endonuclease